jgi:hypothetical protein
MVAMSDLLEQFPEPGVRYEPDDPRWAEYYDRRVYYEGPMPTKQSVQPLTEAFGRNLDTLEKARLWLTNPHNWHSSRLFILKWDGLLVTINEDSARRLIREPWDTGLPWCAVYMQKARRSRKERGESMEEELSPGSEERTDG